MNRLTGALGERAILDTGLRNIKVICDRYDNIERRT